MKYFVAIYLAIIGAVAMSLSETSDQGKSMARSVQQSNTRTQQRVREDQAMRRQILWEQKTFQASSNVIAKITHLPSPMNSKGQIIDQQILSYYENGRLTYATGSVDRARNEKSP